jgi:hypothetical protein
LLVAGDEVVGVFERLQPSAYVVGVAAPPGQDEHAGGGGAVEAECPLAAEGEDEH